MYLLILIFQLCLILPEKAFLRVDLNDMINALPKQLTKRRILNPNTQRELQELISSNTLELLQNQISEFRQALIQYVASNE